LTISLRSTEDLRDKMGHVPLMIRGHMPEYRPDQLIIQYLFIKQNDKPFKYVHTSGPLIKRRNSIILLLLGHC
ncbi:MAG TPA: hypothetical protein VK518_16675, partial [Puia sp.]|nr:hypothetical protein [Puia sp.]